MAKRDLATTLIIVLLIAFFLIPTLLNTGVFDRFPPFYIVPLLFIVIPILGLTGIFIASLIGKKIPLIWQLSKFVTVGFSNTAIDFGIFNSLIFITGITRGIGIVPLAATSFSIAILNSFFWNRRWVFEKPQGASFITFVAVTLIGLAINSSIVYLTTTHIPPIFMTSAELWANFAKALATIVSMVWNFLGYKLIVFKR